MASRMVYDELTHRRVKSRSRDVPVLVFLKQAVTVQRPCRFSLRWFVETQGRGKRVHCHRTLGNLQRRSHTCT